MVIKEGGEGDVQFPEVVRRFMISADDEGEDRGGLLSIVVSATTNTSVSSRTTRDAPLRAGQGRNEWNERKERKGARELEGIQRLRLDIANIEGSEIVSTVVLSRIRHFDL